MNLFVFSGTALAANSTSLAEISVSPETLSQSLMQAALENPDVQKAIEEVMANPEAAAAAWMEASGQTIDAGVEMSHPLIEVAGEAASEGEKHPRDGMFHIGWDYFILGLPGGIGTNLFVTIIAPLTVTLGADTNAVMYDLKAEVTLNILPIFMKAKWTPIVTAGFHHIRFTQLADTLVDKLAPEVRTSLEDEGITFSFEDIHFNNVALMAGLDFVGKKGFHFQITGGKLFQVGHYSQEVMDDGTSFYFENWQSWAGYIKFGHVW